MIDNITSLIENIKTLQKGDYIHTKNHEKANKIYYKYNKIMEILKEIEDTKIKNFHED